MNITVSPPRRADWASLTALLVVAFADDPFLPVVRRRITLATFCPFAFLRLRLIGDVSLLRINGETVGFAIVKYLPDHEAHLWYMAVKREHRSQGLGSHLLEHALGRAARAGYKTVKLETEEGSPAVRLYQRHGFAVTGHLHLLAVPLHRPVAAAPLPTSPASPFAIAGDALWRLLLGIRSRTLALPGGGAATVNDYGGDNLVVFVQRQSRPTLAFYKEVAESFGGIAPPGRKAILVVFSDAAAELLKAEYGFTAYKTYTTMSCTF